METRLAAAAAALLLSAPSSGIEFKTSREISSNRFGLYTEPMETDHIESFVTPILTERVGVSGVKHARVFANWEKIEFLPGQYDWTGLDYLIENLRSEGVAAYLTLNNGFNTGGNALYAGGASPTAANGALTPWLAFVDAAVARYKDRVTTWEVWNEPNLNWKPAVNAADYASLAAQTIPRIRAQQPGAKVVLGGTSLVDLTFTDTVLSVAGALADAVGFHPYRNVPEDSQASFTAIFQPNPAFTNVPGATNYEGEIAALRALLAARGLSRLELHSNEAGFAAQAEGNGLFVGSETRQAKNMGRYMLLNLALGVEHVGVYNAFDKFSFGNNFLSPPGSPWREDYRDNPAIAARGDFATFGFFRVKKEASLAIAATSYASADNVSVAAGTVTTTGAGATWVRYSIAVPQPGYYSISVRLKGSAPASPASILCRVDGALSLAHGATTWAFVASNAGAAALQGASDHSRFYHSPCMHGNAPLPYFPLLPYLSGTASLEIGFLTLGSMDEIRLTPVRELENKPVFAAVQTVAAVFDGDVALAGALRSTFTNVNLGGAEWAAFRSASFYKQRQGQVPLVAYWTGVAPVDSFPADRRVNLELSRPIWDPVVIDGLTGAETPLGAGETSAFSGLPVRDYPMLLTSGSVFRTAGADLSAVRAFPVPYRPNAGDANRGKAYSAADPTSGIVFDRLPNPATIKILSLAGRLLRALDSADAGGTARWDARDSSGAEVPSGAYLALISSPGKTSAVRKLVIIR